MLRHSKQGVDVNTAGVNDVIIDDRYPLLRLYTVISGETTLQNVASDVDYVAIDIDIPVTFDYPFVKPYVSVKSTVDYWNKLYTLPNEFVIEENSPVILRIFYDYLHGKAITLYFYREDLSGNANIPAVDIRYKIPVLVVKEKT